MKDAADSHILGHRQEGITTAYEAWQDSNRERLMWRLDAAYGW